MGNTTNSNSNKPAVEIDTKTPAPTPAKATKTPKADDESSIKKMNIYEKMACISIELTTVAKNLEVQVSKNGKYKAVGEADILRAVKPLENKYRVFSFPFSRTIIENGVIESGDSKKLFERIETVYRFVNIDNKDEYVDITTYGDGIDSGDKSVGKAMTYADKYALMKAYKIVTGDDPDQEASDDNVKDIKVKNALDEKLLARCADLNINLDNLAIYFKTTADKLTDSMLKAAIARKEKSLEAKNSNGGMSND